MSYRKLIIDDDATIADIALRAQRVVVLGIKPESQADQPAHYVSAYLHNVGVHVIPVPVYYPGVREILGIPVVRSLSEVIPPIDIVVVFRRAEDIHEHVSELIALHPTTVWFQRGLRNDEAAEQLAKAGIQVVQNRCIMTEHRHANI